MKIGYDKTHYDIEAQVESSHWWFEGRRRVLKLFLSMLEAQPNRIALEVGCGTGANLKVIQSMGFLGIGLDRSNHPLGLIKEKQDLPLLLGDLTFLPIKTNSLGLIIAMDVFEHLENDKKGIEECYRVLKKEGILFLTLPAFKFLWGVQDEVTGHKRRYRLNEIRMKLEQEGFEILRSSYFNFFLFFPIVIARRLMKLTGIRVESENKINHPLINSCFKLIFSVEPYLLRLFSLPFGVSILCLVRKR